MIWWVAILGLIGTAIAQLVTLPIRLPYNAYKHSHCEMGFLDGGNLPARCYKQQKETWLDYEDSKLTKKEQH